MARSLLFGPFRLDLASRELWRGSQPLPLTPRAMDVLVYLAEHAGELVTRDQLFQELWQDVFVADHVLSVQILEIRKALGDGAHNSAFIETRYRKGYRFCSPVQVVEQEARIAAAAPSVASAPAPLPP